VKVDFWGAAPSFTYGPRRPAARPSSPDVPREQLWAAGRGLYAVWGTVYACRTPATPVECEHAAVFETEECMLLSLHQEWCISPRWYLPDVSTSAPSELGAAEHPGRGAADRAGVLTPRNRHPRRATRTALPLPHAVT
jgi:hypothetical protein